MTLEAIPNAASKEEFKERVSCCFKVNVTKGAYTKVSKASPIQILISGQFIVQDSKEICFIRQWYQNNEHSDGRWWRNLNKIRY